MSTEQTDTEAEPTPEPETLTQFCDRLLGLGDQFMEDWEETAAEGPRDLAGNDERKNAAERRPEWERARKLMLDAVAFVEQMARFESPDDGEDESEMDAWEAMIVKARDIAGIATLTIVKDSPTMTPRAQLLEERNALLKSDTGHAAGRARIREIDRELMLCEGDIEYLNKHPEVIDPAA